MCEAPNSEIDSHSSSAKPDPPAGPPNKLCIFGGGDVSIHVAAIASQTGFKITVIDERPELATAARFPTAAEIYTSIPVAQEKIQLNDTAYLLLATRTHQGDLQILEWALRTAARTATPRYIGMIGKKRKVVSIYQTLLQNGITPAQLESVYAPIGLEIGAETPEEIAVSIAAELIAVRRNAPRQTQQHKSITLADLAAEPGAAT